MPKSIKTFFFSLLVLVSGAVNAISAQWNVRFSTPCYAVSTSTDIMWVSPSNYHIELSTLSVRYLKDICYYYDDSSDIGNREYGYRFQPYMNGHISKLYRYAASPNSADNVIINFWDDNYFAVSGLAVRTVTLMSPSTGWQSVDVSTMNIVLTAHNNYRVSVVICSTTPYSSLYTSPSEGSTVTDRFSDSIIFYPVAGSVYKDIPGYPANSTASNYISGVPDIQMTFNAKTGCFESTVYDTQVNSPRYKSFITSSTIQSKAGDEAVAGSITWQFAVSTNPAGPFNFITYSGGSLTALASSRYLKFKAVLFASTHRNTPKLYGVKINYNRVPSSFTVISPVNQAILGTKSPVFKWHPSYDIDSDTFSYTLEISTYNGFNTKLASFSHISSTTALYSQFSSSVALVDLGVYYWRVKAVDKYNDSGEWIPTRSFSLDYLSDFTIQGSSPADNGKVFAASLIKNKPAFYEVSIRFNKQLDPVTTDKSDFKIKNENNEQLDFNFNVWVNSVTISISTSTVLTIEKSMKYTVSLSTTIKVDQVNRYLSAPYSIEFATLISNQSATTFGGLSSGYDYELTVPAGATDNPLYVQRRELEESDSDDLRNANVNARINELLKSITEKAYSFQTIDSNNNEIDSFKNPVILVVSYAGLVFSADYVYDISDPANPLIKTEALKIFRVGDSGNWELVPNQVQDKPGKKITAQLSSMSIYGVLAYSATSDVLSGVKNMPNPFNAGEQDTVIYYILAEDSAVTIKIYNLIGDMVREFKPADCPGEGLAGGKLNHIHWDGRNGLGMEAADGCYICYVSAVYDTARGKETISRLLKIAVLK